ncbi:MAG: pyridoxal-phosphate dependent enzyme [Chitinophagaceae bacterium]|nr:pyridoxal-phosphate dependent enzyme [Chitinophagaceae bacterium]
MQDIDTGNISTDRLTLPLLTEKNVEGDVLRLDKIHPLVSGNKWFKLRYYLEEAKAEKKTIVTYGGAWSNHILATAAACKLNKLPCIGIIRGEEATNLSPSLIKAKELEMELIFISRAAYGQRKIPERFDKSDYYFIPEGGYGLNGANGAASILNYCKKETYTHICCAAGTGTMTAGLIKAAQPACKITAISVLKNNAELEKNIQLLCGNEEKSFELIHDYHFGGYAKYKTELLDFMNEFYRQTTIPSDFVYTGKLFFAINDLIRNNYFQAGSNLLIIHSGGLQGNASLNNGTLIF